MADVGSQTQLYVWRWGFSLYAFGWTISFGYDVEAANLRWLPVYVRRGYFGDQRD